jgi:uncharacterized protein (TIRG00374 family)
MLKRVGGILLKLGVSGILIWWVTRDVRFTDISIRLQEASLGWLAGVAVLASVQLAILGLRWHAVLRFQGHAVSAVDTARNLMAGIFFNQTLPSGIGGDAVRAWLLVRRRVPLGGAVTAVFTDRATGLITLVVMTAIAVPFLFLDTAVMASAGARYLTPLLAALIAGLVVFYGVLLALPRLPKAATRLGARAQGLYGAVRRALVDRRVAPGLMGLSLASHAAGLLTVAANAQLFAVPVALGTIFVLVPIALVVATLPVSIAGWGVREGAFVTALGLVGVAATDALLLGLATGFVQLAQGLVGGAFWLAGGRGLPPASSPAT